MSTVDDYFSIQAFLIVLRETLESAIIISVLLSFVHQTFGPRSGFSKRTFTNAHFDNSSENQGYTAISASHEPQGALELPDLEVDLVDGDKYLLEDALLYRFLQIQIWVGGLLGLAVCLLVGTVILCVFYVIGNDLWSIAEHYWEGTFSILASVIISVMGIKVLRLSKMQRKWKFKLAQLLKLSSYFSQESSARSFEQDKRAGFVDRISLLAEKYNLVILPFVTTLREGLEAIVFIGGIGINENTSVWALINSTILALILGSLIGLVLYRSGNNLSLQAFLIGLTCFLYLVAAGLFSKGVWNFELQQFINQCGGLDVSETGHGPGSYDIAKSVWHVNCCNGEMQEDGAFWMFVTAIFGWTNSATYGSVISYFGYWTVIIVAVSALLYEERHGYLPLIPIKMQLNRIRKRLRTAQQYQEEDNNVAASSETNRQSLDSVNSETPLRTGV